MMCAKSWLEAITLYVRILHHRRNERIIQPYLFRNFQLPLLGGGARGGVTHNQIIIFMKKELFNRRQVLRFTHFSRKGYALFSVLGREVLVGVLAVSTLTYAKAEGISTVTANALDSLSREETKLDEVVVTGSRVPLTQLQTAKIVAVVTREDIDRATAASINDVLKLVTGVDVRQRGGFGVQTDISVRGGNFDQITILLNGVNISSPHTGHLSADFPVSPDDIERIEVLEGAYERGLCGVVNIITKGTIPHHGPTPLAPSRNGGGVNTLDGYGHLQGGSYGYAGGNAGVNGALANGLWGNVSGGYTRSDGATPNSAFSSSRVFARGGYSHKNINVDAQFGYSYKPYEANTFYGAASTDQWESNERWMAAVKADLTIGKVHLSPSTYYNKWYDHYQWHRHNPAGENFHDVTSQGAALNIWFETMLGKTSLGADLRHEGIWSTKLGVLQDEKDWRNSSGHDRQDDIRYKYHDERDVWTLFAEHNILLRDWTVSLSLNAIHSPFGGWGAYPGMDIAYRPDNHWRLFASWNMAMRMPTFTDLYYGGTGIEGNSELKPEKTSDLQIGARHSVRGFSTEATLFYSHKTDMIDWIQYKEANDDIFHSLNFQMNNWGGELNCSFLPRELFGNQFALRNISARYAYINEDSNYGVTMTKSKYAMEYLRHKVILSADGRLWRNLNLSLSWRWQDRIGTGNSAYALLDGRLSWDANRWSIYIDATNMLNKEYYDYISIRQPGTVVIGGIKMKF